MTQIIADQKDIEFNLYEIFNIETLCVYEKFHAFSKTAFDLILAEAREFAVKEMLAVYRDGDEKGVCYQNGRVMVPESFHKVHRHYCGNQWNAPASDRRYGGQGLPYLVAGAIKEYMMGGNWPIYAYGSMGVTTGKLIELFGTPEQKKTYVRKLYTGQWGGTTLQTEPQAGTGADALVTCAVKDRDGSYWLTGNEICITNGDHDLCSNIIHPVLARVEGDPPGIDGLSIFIVPKYLIRSDGRTGRANDIVCTGIEETHGLHGSATCSMTLGSSSNCRGYLLGKRRQGMEIIYAMMNQARLTVGFQALSYGSAAFLYAADYARNHIQIRDLENPAVRTGQAIPIIRHPDIKRSLIEMKAYTEGLRSLLYFSMESLDRISIETDPGKKEELHDLIVLLAPVIKGYGCEQGYGVCTRAIQVFGGAGYIRDYPVESITRDCKITSIYEGCTGVLALDLLSRKLSMKKGRPFRLLLQKIEKLILKTRKQEQVKDLGSQLSKLLKTFKALARHFENFFKNNKSAEALTYATPFMEVMGDICIAWMLLLRAGMAASALDTKGKTRQDKNFYTGQIRTAVFFYQSILPVTEGKMKALNRDDSVITEMTEMEFGGM